jgi:hypothetical protein
MPESAQFPGVYWATKDTGDAKALVERCKLPNGDPDRLICSVGHAMLDGDPYQTVVIFTSPDQSPNEVGRRMSRELGGVWTAGDPTDEIGDGYAKN